MSTIKGAFEIKIEMLANKQTLQFIQDYHQQTIFNLILFRALKRKPYFQLENSRWRRKGVESCYSGTYPVKTFSPVFLPTAAAGYNMQAFFLLLFPKGPSINYVARKKHKGETKKSLNMFVLFWSIRNKLRKV